MSDTWYLEKNGSERLTKGEMENNRIVAIIRNWNAKNSCKLSLLSVSLSVVRRRSLYTRLTMKCNDLFFSMNDFLAFLWICWINRILCSNPFIPYQTSLEKKPFDFYHFHCCFRFSLLWILSELKFSPHSLDNSVGRICIGPTVFDVFFFAQFPRTNIITRRWTIYLTNLTIRWRWVLRQTCAFRIAG